jgi:hypothetical protein
MMLVVSFQLQPIVEWNVGHTDSSWNLQGSETDLKNAHEQRKEAIGSYRKNRESHS